MPEEDPVINALFMICLLPVPLNNYAMNL